MNTLAKELREQRAALAELESQTRVMIATLLDTARGLEPSDQAGAGELLKVAEFLGRREQADHGTLVRVLAQVDRVRAAPGGVTAWTARHLDVSDGRARAIAQAARRIGAVPELAEPLSSGKIGADTVSVLSRTAKAVVGTCQEKSAALATTLDLARREGVAAAKLHVRVLENPLAPVMTGDLITQQRERSFARVAEVRDGMCRFEILLDAARSTTLRSAIDLVAAHWIRKRQHDGVDPLPADVRSTEQIRAQAFTHLAEVFHKAPAKLREAVFTPPMLNSAPLTATKPWAGWAVENSAWT